MARGITITNYLSNGDPEGVIFSYMSNWSGQAIKIPRNLFVESKSIPELQRPGLYILIGPNIDKPENIMVYIGEANILAERIMTHLRDAGKDFAETIICFCSKDENLMVHHTKYLELKVIGHLLKSAQFTLVNKTAGNSNNLSRMAKDEMDTYFDNMRVILPTLGYSLLHTDNRIVLNDGDKKRTTFYLDSGGLKATAFLTSNGMEVNIGSIMNANETKALSGSYSDLRKILIEKGIVIKEGNSFIFKEAYEFSSPSSAAAVILGYSANGRIIWKTETGKTLKELEEDIMKMPILE